MIEWIGFGWSTLTSSTKYRINNLEYLCTTHRGHNGPTTKTSLTYVGDGNTNYHFADSPIHKEPNAIELTKSSHHFSFKTSFTTLCDSNMDSQSQESAPYP